MPWMNDHTLYFYVGVISYPCSDFNADLANLFYDESDLRCRLR